MTVRRLRSFSAILALLVLSLISPAEAQVLGRARALARPLAANSAVTPAGPQSQIQLGPASQSAFTTTATWVRRIPNPAELDRVAMIPGMDGVIETYVLFIPATGTFEAFTIYAPQTQPGVRLPMLTAFHAFGVGWLGIRTFSGLIPEAIQRGWFLVAPWQRNTAANANVSYASVQSQLHVEAVMDLVLHRYRVDRDRIYGIGFSMGGGNALSYAARHRDRRGGAFAAVVNHTGSVALANVYANVNSDVRMTMEATFGGNPATAPFEYQRSSLIELDAAGDLVSAGGRHMAVNLASVPVQSWYNTGDSLGYLRDQTIAFHGFLEQLSGAGAQLRAVPPFTGCVGQHCWDTIDRTDALNWLALQTLDVAPTAGTILMDRDGRWGVFDITQAQSGAFTQVDFAVEAASNSLQFGSGENLRTLAANVQRLGLRTDQDLELKAASGSGLGSRIRLEGWSSEPTVVTRDGVTQFDACPLGGAMPGWCFDSQGGAIEIFETSPQATVWLIQP